MECFRLIPRIVPQSKMWLIVWRRLQLREKPTWKGHRSWACRCRSPVGPQLHCPISTEVWSFSNRLVDRTKFAVVIEEPIHSQVDKMNMQTARRPDEMNHQSHPAASNVAGGGGGLFGSLKGQAGSLFKNIKDTSSKVMQTVQAWVNWFFVV